MSNSPIAYAREAQDAALGVLRQSQESVVEAVGSWAKAVESAAPDTAAVPVPKDAPTLNEMVQSSFDFAGELLSAQRRFSEELIAAAAPAMKTAAVETKPKAKA